MSLSKTAAEINEKDPHDRDDASYTRIDADRDPRSRAFGDPIGRCLSCGHRLTLCGTAFSARIRCAKCNKINVYQDSQQPVRLAQ